MAMLNRKTNGRGIFREYAYYQFRKNEQDPIIDALKTIHEDEGESISRDAEQSGLSDSTLRAWWTRCTTQKPQYTSIVAYVRSKGYDIAFVKSVRRNAKEWEASGPKILNRK